MALFITSLNSGSNGNCYYVGNKNEAILVDVGISCRTILKRLNNLQLDPYLIKAIFISHEHTDHIKGLKTLSEKLRIPVFISEPTSRNTGMELDTSLLNFFADGEMISIGKLQIHAFSKIHDAVDPFSFCVGDSNTQVGIFTDIGRCDETITYWFKHCDAAFLEANYDEDMLASGPYPYRLKQRISGGRGHLSNWNAYRLFADHHSGGMSHLILSHLSANNNKPEIVENLFKTNNDQVEIIVAPRNCETPVFEIGKNGSDGKKTVSYRQLTFDF